MSNKYTEKYIDRIKQAEDDSEIEQIIDRIYSDGFEDGSNEKD